jgi:predicted ATP-dependent serine protease
MILTWCCSWCGWANDNNPGACRKCGKDEEFSPEAKARQRSANPKMQVQKTNKDKEQKL